MNKVTKFGVVAMAAAMPFTAFAAAPSTVQGVVDFFAKILGWVSAVFFLVATAMIIFAAFKYVTAKGDPKAIDAAKGMLKSAIIGVAIAVVAYAIPKVVSNVFGESSVQTGGTVQIQM